MPCLNRKRSSWLSGRGYVPSNSIGFWVAMTKNGGASRCVSPVDRHPALLHRLQQGRLRCAGARLISSASTTLAEDRAGDGTELAGLAG